MFFYYELALSFGCTIPELLSRMSSSELTGWIAFIKEKNKREKAELDKNKAPEQSKFQTFRN